MRDILEQWIKNKFTIPHGAFSRSGILSMSEYQTFLGSAASVDAVALGGADGHSLGKAKRRASSQRRAAAKPVQGADRSRSPEREAPPDVRTEVAERVMLAPVYA